MSGERAVNARGCRSWKILLRWLVFGLVVLPGSATGSVDFVRCPSNTVVSFRGFVSSWILARPWDVAHRRVTCDAALLHQTLRGNREIQIRKWLLLIFSTFPPGRLRLQNSPIPRLQRPRSGPRRPPKTVGLPPAEALASGRFEDGLRTLVCGRTLLWGVARAPTGTRPGALPGPFPAAVTPTCSCTSGYRPVLIAGLTQDDFRKLMMTPRVGVRTDLVLSSMSLHSDGRAA